MSYLRGSGTQSDPYVIHNADAFIEFLTNGYKNSLFFEVVADIVISGVYTFSYAPKFTLNLNGHSVRGFALNATRWSAVIEYYPASIKITNGEFIFSTNAARWGETNSTGEMPTISTNLIDVVFDAGKPLSDYGGYNGISYAERTLFKYPVYGVNGFTKKNCYCLGSMNGVTDTSSTPYLPAAYPALLSCPSVWILDGVSYPQTIRNGRTDLTTGYAIKGVTRVGNSRKSRDIAILSAAYRLPVWSGKSDAEGKFFAPLYDYYDAVIPLIFDDYGYPLKKDTSYVVGDVIHPSTPNGYRYICEQVGTSGPTLPAEPWSVEVLLTVGTAKFRPHPVYEPKCLGPIYPGKVNLVTGEKV